MFNSSRCLYFINDIEDKLFAIKNELLTEYYTSGKYLNEKLNNIMTDVQCLSSEFKELEKNQGG